MKVLCRIVILEDAIDFPFLDSWSVFSVIFYSQVSAVTRMTGFRDTKQFQANIIFTADLGIQEHWYPLSP